MESKENLASTYIDIEKKGKDNKAFDPGNDDLKRNGDVSKTEEDIWALPELHDTGKPWNEMTSGEKVRRVFLAILKVIFLLAFLYMFICSLDFLSSAFRLLGGRTAGHVFRDNVLLKNPVAGLMIGVLATVLVQSSSTSTSIVVSMVAADELIDVKTAIPIVMGANIGTSVTNTIVAMGQITSKEDFRRAFAGATVHDMFNWMAVLVLLPLEIITGYLRHLSQLMIDSMHLEKYEHGDKDLLKAITNPFTKLVVEVDKKGIEKIAQNQHVESLLKMCCKSKNIDAKNETINGSLIQTNASTICVEECDYWFKNTGLSDTAIGVILLVVSLIILCSCLLAIVKILNSLLRGNIRKLIKKFINYEFPGKCSYFTGYIAVIFGCGMTILVQSSSIFTSTLTPLVGVGVISLERMYPLTLGSNIGTTTTGILAALASDIEHIKPPLQVAFCHLFFNISGIILYYPIPWMRFPIPLAKFLGCQTAKYRWYSIVYLVFMFFLLPAAVFGLSVAGWEVLAGVLVPLIAILLIVLLIKLMQKKCPKALPSRLRNWKFLPEPLRSLAPLDRMFQFICFCSSLKCCRHEFESTDDTKSPKSVDKEMTPL